MEEAKWYVVHTYSGYENTEFARNYLDNETFRNFVNSRVFQQARAIV